METILIPFYEPDAKKIIDAYPEKVVLNDGYVEIYSKNSIIKDDDDTGLPTEQHTDCISLIMKKWVASIETGKMVKKEGFAVHIYFLDRHQVICFVDKQPAKEFYLKLHKWLVT